MVCMILQRFVLDAVGVPFQLTVVVMVALIWLYTRRGGIKTLVWTDTFQTTCMFAALLLIIYNVTASLGLSLGVIADYIYPIIIAVSVITTLTTPFFIKHSDNIYAFVVKLLPEKLTQKLERYTDEEQSEKEQDSDWSAFLSRYIRTVALYGVIMAGIGIIGRYWLLPLLETALPSASAAKAVTLAVIYLGMALFIRPMLDTRSPQYTVLWMKKRSFRLPLMALSGIRILLIALIAFIPLRNIAGIGSAWLLPVIVAALLLASRMGWLASA